ncbi:sensor histidine kinase [Clostridium sp. 19966]|uniref:sensor histidine kinase n=1 Tax=Clostridium sp. 19966 TaxID=2768166 RepID=UPI0028DD5343|nr:sensor histidine kinase [Clostridium sp. 19966]MDT8719589.1 sensor histidine kinase [Clostridium sp. 19966]
MYKKIQREKYMICLRYMYIFTFILYFISEYNRINNLVLIALLIYIINNQVRYFILPKKQIYGSISIILDLVMSYYIYPFGEIFGVLIFIPALIDIAYEYKIYYSVLYILSAEILVAIKGNFSMMILLFITSLPIFLLMIRVKEEEYRKINAQHLYDVLREKEEELKKANEELESYASTIEEIAVLRERNRISREIHDSVGHALSTMIIQLRGIDKIIRKDSEKASKLCIELADFAKESMESVRAAVRAMKPRELEEYEGIIAVSEMIKNFQKLSGIEVNLRVSDNVWKLNSDQTMAIYRIIQEFLSNSLRHGKASRVNIFLNFLQDGIRLHLKDDGTGAENFSEGVGLRSIRERLSSWGGSMQYFTKPGKGFELAAYMDKGKLSLDGIGG